MARPIWTPDAVESLEAIAEYIARSSPGYAGPFLARIVDATEMLEEFPWAGRTVPEFHVEAFREVIFQNYRIVYEVLDGRVWILLVVHGAVDLPAQLRKRGIAPS